MRALIFIVGILAGTSVMAGTVTVTMDFEGVVGDSSNLIPSAPYIEDGLLLESARTENGIFGKDAYSTSNGTAIFAWCNEYNYLGCGYNAMTTLSTAENNVFDLLSIDAAAVSAGIGITTIGPISVTGHLAGGGTVNTQLNTSPGWQTFSFDSQWTDLLYVELTGSGDSDVGIDNIVVSTVPVPAAVWLFGSALVGLGWLRRQRSA